ncbi:MAG: 30S ribosomal protein S9 [Candidatus Shapirobacteria bacterium GW2011_GWF1_38_23]|nr:MAG: 30S ribosomal protein S9 [Candidatus Shapirobacteria bacterium GW2011_GWF2_37_20]KKQ64761.1 MAG: 30S ribosomal protein S9 [Candidatus Shapirobacteria bacterium GW2011_GWF1_38_23]
MATPKTSKKTTNAYVYALGRRKSAVASVKLFKGKGDSTINTRPVNKYFPLTFTRLELPFKTTETENKFHFAAKIVGGGRTGQLAALILAISRALKKGNPDMTLLLAQAGLLTVDARVRERRMVGTGGKARRKKQSPKR